MKIGPEREAGIEILLYGFTAAASVSDLRQGKIPNRLTWLLCLSLILYQLFSGLSAGGEAFDVNLLRITVLEIFRILIRGAAVFVFLFPFFLFRMMGAGDIKLFAAVCGGAGMEEGLWILFYTFGAAGLWSAVRLSRGGLFRKRAFYLYCYIGEYLSTGKKKAYFSPEEDEAVSVRLAPFLFAGMTCFLAVGGFK